LSMFTQCPKCGSYFRVRDEELHAADGHVRCSLCTNTFNALSHLEPELPQEEDKRPVNLDWMEEAEHSAEDQQTPTTGHDPLTGDLFESTPSAPATSPKSETKPQPDAGPAPAGKTKTAQKKTAQAEGFAPWFDAEAQTSAEPSSMETSSLETSRETSAEITTESSTETSADASEESAAAFSQDQTHANTLPSPFELPADEAASPSRLTALIGRESPAWVVGSITLLMLLGIQFIHMERIYWAQHDWLGGIVSASYQQLTGQVPQERDLEKLRVVRTDMAGTDRDDGHLRVTSVVENHGNSDQPIPAVYVRLEDRWGLNMGHAFFEPEEWVHRETLPDGFAARSRLPLRLELSDPGRDAVSFHIELCWSEGEEYTCRPRRGGAAFTR